MGTGYQRADVGNLIANGEVVDADVLDLEFNAVESAFNSTAGHTHDGTTAEGGPITKTGPTQDFTHNSLWLEPKTTNTIDIGSTEKRFKNGWFQGLVTTAAGFVGDLVGNVTGNLTGNVAGNADTATRVNNVLTAGTSIVSTGTFDGSVARTFSVTSTSARNSASTTDLLQAKAMSDHVASGDHDARYAQLGTTNTFTANYPINLESDFPVITFIDSNGTVNERKALLAQNSGLFTLYSTSDDGTFKSYGYVATHNSSGFLNHGFFVDGNEAARIEGVGASSPYNISVITREKGDARYLRLDGTNALSSRLRIVSALYPSWLVESTTNDVDKRKWQGFLDTSGDFLISLVNDAETSLLSEYRFETIGTANYETSVMRRANADVRYAQLSNNLSDLTNPAASRSNLGLGNAATRDVGTSDTQVLNSTSANTLYPPLSRSITAAGLATGGGTLNTNLDITVPISSQAQAEAGIDNTVAMTPLRVAQAITATAKASRFVSSEILMAAPGPYGASHGLGVEPDIVKVYVVNRSGGVLAGWADGERVLLSIGSDQGNSGNFISIQSDNTNSLVVFSANLVIPNKNAVGVIVANYSQWRLVIEAIRIP